MRRFAFELKMQDKSTFLLAADSEAEMEEWISTLNKILHSSFEQAVQEKRNGDLHEGVCFCLSPCTCCMCTDLCGESFLIVIGSSSLCNSPSLFIETKHTSVFSYTVIASANSSHLFSR